ncbi:DUF1622 domain-containing protein [Holdemania massiliensis]|uniref:DUF1622 domain-containing protein n=1 Tax=Holdemania massiliensis TaxID=1468449 RepID=UPI001F062E3A|nr:DUF1622 domain-containing protein [Holdemania massiliensis]MCH1942361.1 DUF1622 domain-containing protein [Holdemania massiliensis]
MIQFKELIVKGGEVAVLFFELLALIMIIYAGCKGAISLFKKDDNVALDLLKGFSTGLSFLLGAEILKTIALEEVSELMMVGGVIAMRVALSILIHWEMKQEQHEREMELIEKQKD